MKTFYSINGRPVLDTEFAPFAASALAQMQDRLRDVETERDYLAAMLDRVWETAQHSYPFVAWPAWTPDQEAAAIIAHAAAHKAVSDDLLRILDAPTTGDKQ